MVFITVSGPREWEVWLSRREWFTYKVSRCWWSEWAESAYQHAKTSKGRVMRFWTLKGAQAYADKLNKETTTGEIQ